MLFSASFMILAASSFMMMDGKVASDQYFLSVRDSNCFVDKTKLVREILSGDFFWGDRGPITTIKPTHIFLKIRRGFGKTTNLDMIRRFAEVDIHPNGTAKTKLLTHKNYKTFNDIVPSTGKHLKLLERTWWFREHFGKYPVIWLDLDPKGVKTYTQVDFIYMLLNSTIKAAFQEHLYLLESVHISARDKQLAKKYLALESTTHKDFVRGYSPRQGIMLLKKLLKEHFQRDPIGLVDNIDAPVREIIYDRKQDTDEAVEKMLALSSVLAALPTGDAYINATPAFRTVFAGAIHPHIGTHVRLKSVPGYFNGFTKEEVTSLLTPRHLEHEMEPILAWYGGYERYQSQTHLHTCNTYSVLRFLRGSKELKPYWPELKSLEPFKGALSPDCFGQQLVECFEKCYVSNFAEISPEDVRLLQRLQTTTKQCKEKTLRPFLVLLENLGFLETTSITLASSQALTIPNFEVRGTVAKMLYEAVVAKTPLNGDSTFRSELFEALINVDSSECSIRRLADTLLKLLSALDNGYTEGATYEAHSGGALAHSIRVHLLHPPPEFSVTYVSTARSKEGKDKRDLSNPDLVFVVDGKETPLAFVIKIEMVDNLTTAGPTLTDAYSQVFTTQELKNVTEGAVKVLANLRCDDHTCKLSYLYDTTNLGQEKHLEFLRGVAKIR